jgi:ADP-ribosylglycohydrolase
VGNFGRGWSSCSLLVFSNGSHMRVSILGEVAKFRKSEMDGNLRKFASGTLMARVRTKRT